LISGAYASAQTLTTLYSFGSGKDDGVDPQAGIVFDKAGNLYGTASVGGIAGANGILFQLSPAAVKGSPWKESILHRFRGTPDGKIPECRVVVMSTGNLFGTTWSGGANNSGTAFVSFPPAVSDGPWTERPIYSFGSSSVDGVNPNAALLAGKQAFYGVTFGGGASGMGTVFQLTPPSDLKNPWTETVLHSFSGSGDAAFPSSELVMDKNGNLYGTTTLGGANNLGAVYEVSPPKAPSNPWTEEVIFSFSGSDGTLPAGRLQLDGNGALYGTTDGGGAGSEGTVFKLRPPVVADDPWTETVLYSFSGGRDGSNPAAGVVMDGKGRLFGTAQHGGSGNPKVGGVVFELDPPTVVGGVWTETVLHSFSGNDGFLPNSTLMLRKDGIYGTTAQGGLFGTGTVFVLTP
jgi:uncharacterized repeat protein (TIGR03803 family)